MVGYKLSKNDWVTPFFVIFRSVREILLVTVFFDHPVARGGAGNTAKFVILIKFFLGQYQNHFVCLSIYLLDKPWLLTTYTLFK